MPVPDWSILQLKPESSHKPSRGIRNAVVYQDSILCFLEFGLTQSDVWKFDLVSHSWTEIKYKGQAPLWGDRTLAFIKNDKICLFGMFKDKCALYSLEVEKGDNTGEWRQIYSKMTGDGVPVFQPGYASAFSNGKLWIVDENIFY